MSIYFIYEIWNPSYIVYDLLVFFCFFLPLPVSYDTIISPLQGAEKDIKYQDN